MDVLADELSRKVTGLKEAEEREYAAKLEVTMQREKLEAFEARIERMAADRDEALKVKNIFTTFVHALC